LEDRIPATHPLRAIREIVDTALAGLSRAFAKLYARDGRPSIPPTSLMVYIDSDSVPEHRGTPTDCLPA
jgi:hypothetical protein